MTLNRVMAAILRHFTHSDSLIFEGNHIKPSEAKPINACQNYSQKILVLALYDS